MCCEVCSWDTSDAMMEPDGLKCIANAEYVLEGYLCHDKTVREDINSNTGKAMPEFPGYTGDAKPALPVIKITAVTYRKNPIMQSCIGPSHEHVSMAGIPTEASIISMVDRAIPGCHCHVLDPSNDHALDPSIRVHGIACKAIFDCTVPFDQKENFVRSRFLEIDKDKWAKELAF